MNCNIENFDAAVHPLQKGVNVVEASAGTGKTFSIAMLVLRFVAEFGIPVEKLLVVSYTKAATEELRSRIRRRLLEGRDFLRDGTDGRMVGVRSHLDILLFSNYISLIMSRPLLIFIISYAIVMFLERSC